MSSMDNDHIKRLCLSLMHADTEDEVIELLSHAGLWDNPDVWRYYGDKPNNSGQVRGQQSKADAALVEKIVNSVDACLMNEYLIERQVDSSVSAPQNIQEAVARYYDSKRSSSSFAGRIREWGDKKRTSIARNITLSATGAMGRVGNPSFSIADRGEGQTPDMIPHTFVSFSESNKIDILFVQGQFNMGGAGVLRFCGINKLQLIVSRRNPKLVNGSKPSDNHWGFTVVRREPPMKGRKVAVYTFLAPLNLDAPPEKHGVLNFRADSMPIMPNGREAYGLEVEHGSLIKLYEYVVEGNPGNILLAGSTRQSLLNRLELRLPDLALPVRLHECRKGYRGHAGSFEKNLLGLGVHLSDDKAQNIEDKFPSTLPMSVMGQEMLVTVYAFKPGKAAQYRRNEGIVFSINGQTQGYITKDFFARESVRQNRLKDSILVIVDCSKFDDVGREELFMSSRDRLSGNPIRKEIEKVLTKYIREHEELRALSERRKREETEEKLKEDKPLEDVLDSIIKHSPSLASIFSIGKRLSTPFKTKDVQQKEKPYTGKIHPTYFKLKGKDYGQSITRDCHINLRARITFETDVVNDYFGRDIDRGEFALYIINGNEKIKATGYIGPKLNNGIATLSIQLPNNVGVGDSIHFEAVVNDPIAIEPFINKFNLNVLKEVVIKSKPPIHKQPPSDNAGKDRESPLGIMVPKSKWIKREEWEEQSPSFNKYTAMRAITDYEGDEKVYSFYLNANNFFLETELKTSDDEPRLIRARFKYGMMLIGLSILYDFEESKKLKNEDDETDEENGIIIEDKIEDATKAIAPVLLPMISNLGDLVDKDDYYDEFAGEED